MKTISQIYMLPGTISTSGFPHILPSFHHEDFYFTRLIQLKWLQWEHRESQLASGASMPLYVSPGLGEQDVPNSFADYSTGGLFTFSPFSLVSNMYWKNKHAHVRECRADTTFVFFPLSKSLGVGDTHRERAGEERENDCSCNYLKRL